MAVPRTGKFCATLFHVRPKFDQIQAPLTSTISAGIAGLKNIDPKTLELSQRLTHQFLKATTDVLSYAIVDATVRGDDLVTYLQDHLKTMLLASVVDTAHAEATQQIKLALLSSHALKNLAQTLAGCAAGAARGGSCTSGALGSATAELIGILKPPHDPINGYSETEKTDLIHISQLVAGTLSAYTGHNPQSAVSTAKTTAENNVFFVPPLVLGTVWLVDKGFTAYELYQDMAALADGEKTVNDLIWEKGEEYAVQLVVGNVAKYGLKLIKNLDIACGETIHLVEASLFSIDQADPSKIGIERIALKFLESV
jgi:hypothetical protein